MLSHFNTELDDLFNEKYLTPELLKYYQDPLIIKVKSTEIECYHGQHLIKFISFGESFNIRLCRIHSNKLYIVSANKFFTYDFRTNEFHTLDTKPRGKNTTIEVGSNIMTLKYNSEAAEI